MLKRGFQFAPGYRLQEFLGKGQFGQVWRASAPGGAATAVKFIDLSDGQGQKEYDAIRRVKQIRHANLMPITAIWLLDAQGRVMEEAPEEAMETIDLSVPEAPGRSAIYQPELEPSWLVVAMLLGGKSLHQRLRECIGDGLTGIPPKELISYMEESAKGIDFLNMPQHDLGEGPIAIQHSDIKPANIVLIGSSAVVCDFGLARILTRNQVTATSAAGTPAYMAPEAISGKPSRTSDQYSLAVSYYHLRTGELPLNDGSLWEVLDAHRHGRLRFSRLPEAEQRVLRKATDLQWENRFENCLDFVDALREALRSEGETRPSFAPLNAANSNESADSEFAFGPTGTQVGETGQAATKKIVETSTGRSEAEMATTVLDQAEKSTRRNTGVAATLKGLGDAASPATEIVPASVPALQRLKQHPKILAGIAVALSALVLAIVLPLILGGNNSPPRTSEELLAEAVTLVDTDTQLARSLFLQVVKDNAEWKPTTRRIADLDGPVMQLIATPDGRRLVAMADGPAPVLTDLIDGDAKQVLLQGHETLINSMATDSSGGLLLTGGFDADARVWNLLSETVATSPLVLKGHTGEVDCVAWNPSKTMAITSSFASANGIGEIGLWELSSAVSDSSGVTLIRERRIPISEKFTSLTVDGTGTWVAAATVGSDPIAPATDVVAFRMDELWNTEGSPTPIRLNAKNAARIAFLSRYGKAAIAVGERGGSVAVFSLSEDKPLIDRWEPPKYGEEHQIEALRVVSIDTHDIIAAGSSDGSVLWWKFGELGKNQRRVLTDHAISCVDLSADGRWVAAGTTDGHAWLWDTQSKEPSGVIQLGTNSTSVDSIAIASAANLLIAGCDDGSIQAWDLAHLKLMAVATPSVPTFQGPAKVIVAPKLTMK